MLETDKAIIKFLKQTILETDLKAIDFGHEKDFTIIPGTFDDDYYDLLLENDGCDIHFKVYYETEESDCFVTIDLEDGLHESIHVKFNFEHWGNDFYQFCIAMKIILGHYIIGNWTETMAEMEVIGFVRFVEKYLNTITLFVARDVQ
ncbi:TPA: hypothetical protein U1B35_000937 [Streptococcus suis]|uniref:hypothetical protein n=1 Tax=Streptococcus suis TaxID=1307 RepID=UPI000CF4AFA1|nr:hypothetical protein [Streptococcus suis]QZS51026.1 hypothetical protein K6976_09470 [Streptococcus suis]HEM3523003.1 hypothetical protein [Streptococcus suis]HEM3537262.1 hypothetical protein [Streptococcus suis]HEM6536185.1 hypothetical protein [Streptococcus suis]